MDFCLYTKYHKAMTTLIKSIASKIRYLRKKNNLSQVALAELAGVHEKTIISIESGKHSITLDVLEKISKVFNITPYDLLRQENKTVSGSERKEIIEQVNKINNSLNKILLLINNNNQ